MYHLFLTPPIGVLCCHISLAAHNPQQAVPQNSRLKRDAASACASTGKLHPTLLTNAGSHFPPRPSTGNRIPFIGRILGCSFHRAPQRETASHSKGKFRDKVSESPLIRKAHPTLNTSGYVFSATCYAQALQCGARPAASCCMNPIEWCEKKPGYVWQPYSI